MRKLLGRIGEWAVTRPAQTIAAVVSVIAIVGVVGALRLTPDASTDKLVDNGSETFQGTQEFRQRFGDDAIVVLVKGDLDQILLTDNINRLLSLEGCLAGRPDPSTGQFAARTCQEIADMGVTRVVFGPATFLDQAAQRASQNIQQQIQGGLLEDPAALQQAQAQFLQSGLSIGDLSNLSINNTNFVQAVVYDQATDGRPPKAKRGYLFPSRNGALISIRLQPDVTSDERRQALSLIRQTLSDDAFKLKSNVSYEVSGIPVVVQGLSDALAEQILVLFGAALAVMALVLIFIFGPPLRLLPLLTAIGSAGFALGLLAILGGTLTMASVAVLPVVIGLGVDYAIQLQARFREATERGERPPAAAVAAAVRGGPVVGTAALATGVGFLSLTLSPVPMVREFAIALVAGIAAALAISLTAGMAALSMTPAPGSPESRRGRRIPFSGRLRGVGATSLAAAPKGRVRSMGRAALATAIQSPGRVLAIGAVLAITGWVAGTGTKTVSDIRELVPGDLPALQSLTDVEDVTGVSAELDVLVSGDVTSPEAIRWMAKQKDEALSEHGFTKDTVSCLDDGVELCPGPALSDLFDLDSGAKLDDSRISSVLGLVPPYFSQAVLSRGEDGSEDVAAATFLIPVMPLDEQEALIDDVRSSFAAPPGDVSAEVVGFSVLAADANAQLAGSRYWLTLVCLLVVGLALLAVYRRPARAFVPMLPIALATGWSALVLEAIGVSLNPMSSALGVLVIAVATEFSVILSARYYEEREAGASVGESLRLTYSRTGVAVLASGITSIAGFGVLSLSGITMLRDFGLATVVDLSASVAGVMLVLPAALVWAESGFSPLPALRDRLADPSEGGAGAGPNPAS